MKKVSWGASGIKVPAVALGCMRLEALTPEEAARYLEKAVSLGIDFFDHADIYGQGRCETLFAKALAQTELKREALWIQSKCGIVSGVCYNFDKEHILKATDGILKRLNVEYLDSLLLHRPDALMEPEEVAAAFDKQENRTGVNAPTFQFMRVGYFCLDNRDSSADHLVFNRSVSLKDSFKK